MNYKYMALSVVLLINLFKGGEAMSIDCRGKPLDDPECWRQFQDLMAQNQDEGMKENEKDMYGQEEEEDVAYEYTS